jgi:predicted HD superfamily hydrolase involved in NAD metabolism
VTEAGIKARLEKRLSKHRFRHTLSVARWAEKLARLHGEDPRRARLAGLLHDCAKEMPALRLSTIVRLHRLPVPGKAHILKSRRFGLFHAHVSAWVARTRFGVKDKAVLSAVAKHTLGDVRMSGLDKVLYVADFSAPQRKYAAAARVRKIARKDLDAALKESVRCKLLDVLERGKDLHPMTVRLYNGE